jgi:hypothetical protein
MDVQTSSRRSTRPRDAAAKTITIVMLPTGARTQATLAGARPPGRPRISTTSPPLTFTRSVAGRWCCRLVKFGEPFRRRCRVEPPRHQGRLSLFRNSEFLGSQVVRLSAGRTSSATGGRSCTSSIHVYQAAMGSTATRSGRTTAPSARRGRGRPSVARRQGQSHAQSLAGALRSQNIDVTVVEPPGFRPSGRPAEIRRDRALERRRSS